MQNSSETIAKSYEPKYRAHFTLAFDTNEFIEISPFMTEFLSFIKLKNWKVENFRLENW